MVTIHQHELGVARNEGYAKGHAAATGYFNERIYDIERTHRSIIDTKNAALVSFSQIVEAKNEQLRAGRMEISNLASQVVEQREISAALQQSLEEATARIEALTMKPAFKVGDMVRHHDGVSPFEIVRINRLGSLDIRSPRTNVVYHNRNAAHYVKVS